MQTPSFGKRCTAAIALAAACLVPAASHADDRLAEVKMFAPTNGQRAGVGGFGWFVDLAVEFDTPLERTGFTGLQLTGPGVHNNALPMPGTFSPGSLPYGEACSISAFNSAPTRMASPEM